MDAFAGTHLPASDLKGVIRIRSQKEVLTSALKGLSMSVCTMTRDLPNSQALEADYTPITQPKPPISWQYHGQGHHFEGRAKHPHMPLIGWGAP